MSGRAAFILGSGRLQKHDLSSGKELMLFSDRRLHLFSSESPAKCVQWSSRRLSLFPGISRRDQAIDCMYRIRRELFTPQVAIAYRLTLLARWEHNQLALNPTSGHGHGWVINNSFRQSLWFPTSPDHDTRVPGLEVIGDSVALRAVQGITF